MGPDFCSCGRRLKGRKNVVKPKDDDDKIEIKCTETCDVDVIFERDESSITRCTPPRLPVSNKPYVTKLYFAPAYKRPVGSEVLTCYKLVVADVESSNCLGFLNSKASDATWATFKKQVPMANGRILRLPAKSQLHFNKYFIRDLHPDCAASWKLLEKPKE